MWAESVYYRNSHLYSTVQHSDGPSVLPDGRSLDCPVVPAVSSQNICYKHTRTTNSTLALNTDIDSSVNNRVSTNLTEQIFRRFPGDSRRDFKKNPGHVCIASACYVM